MFTASLNLDGLQSMLPKDPVCGATVDVTKAIAASNHGGSTYYFCGSACKEQFDAEPAKFIAKAPA